MLITFEQLKAQNNGQGSGQKWAMDGNVTEIADYFGTKNNFPILFKTNSIQRMILTTDGFLGINVSTALAPLHVNGEIIFNNLGGSADGLVCADPTGKLKRISFTGNNQHVLLGDGTFGTYTDNDWKVEGNNTYNLNLGNVGINTTTPEYPLDVNGDAKIRGELSVGNSIKFNGVTDQITTTTGTLDFGNTNIITSGNINANQVNLSGNATLDNVTVNTLTVNNTTTTNKLISNTSIDLKSAIRFTGTNSAIVSNSDLKVETTGNVKFNTTGNTIINGRTGIGIDEPIEMLDIAGNANIRGYLYVQDGVIIGRRITGEKVSADTIEITQKLSTREIEATEKIKSSNITIDGENSKITSTTGGINFEDDNLITTGKVNANIIKATTIETNNLTITNPVSLADLTITDKLEVANSIKVGENSLWLTSSSPVPGSDENSIYTTNGDLKIQNTGSGNNTILNETTGSVGIGRTPNGYKLDVLGTGRFGKSDVNYVKIGYNGSHAFLDGFDENDADEKLHINWYSGANVVVGGAYTPTDNGKGDFTSLHNTYLANHNGNVTIGSGGHPANLEVKGDVKINSLIGAGTRMVTAKNDGTLDFQDIAMSSVNGNVGIGTSAPEKIHQNAGLFANSTPKLEILTGSGNSPFSELITIRHSPVDEIANLRQLGLVFKLSDETINNYDQSSKMGGLMLESTQGWANSPSLFLLTNNQKQVELKSNGDFNVINGNFGIGKSNPEADLHIDKFVTTASDATTIRLQRRSFGLPGSPTDAIWDIENSGTKLNFKFAGNTMVYMSFGVFQNPDYSITQILN